MLWFGSCVSCRLSFGVHGGGFLFVGLIDDGFGFENMWVLLNFLVFLGCGL